MARVTSIRTLCFEQPAVPIHAQRFAGRQQIVLTVLRSDSGQTGCSMARAHGGQPGRGIADAIRSSLAPRVLGQDVLFLRAISPMRRWRTRWSGCSKVISLTRKLARWSNFSTMI